MKLRLRIRGAKSDTVAVYSDEFMPLLSALGESTCARATSVEWDDDNQEWVARLRDASIIARGSVRKKVIEEEIAWLNENLDFVV